MEISEITPKLTEKEEIEPAEEELIYSSDNKINPTPEPKKPIIQKCSDGTIYGQCSANKPKYCDRGELTNRASLCGCFSDFKIDRDQCVDKLSQNCGIIHEGAKDNAKAINFIIIPADLLYGVYRDDPNVQYSNNPNSFIADANKNVNDFLSIDPINKYQNAFNFYYTTSSVVKCTLAENEGFVLCDLWKEAADDCGISYDEVIILQHKPRGGLWGGPWIQSGLSSLDFTHEIGHFLGLRDVDNFNNLPSPSLYTNLNFCGGTVCQVQNWCSFNRIESGGPNCCFYMGSAQNMSFYIPNEETAYYSCDEKVPKFNHLERAYLNELFTKILSGGKDRMKCGSWFNLDKYCLYR